MSLYLFSNINYMGTKDIVCAFLLLLLIYLLMKPSVEGLAQSSGTVNRGQTNFVLGYR